MRLLKIGVYHPGYLENFFKDRPELSHQPFAVQHAALMADFFGSSDSWTSALTGLGYETCDIVVNAKNPQLQWAKENGLGSDGREWLLEIAIAQIKQLEPTVLLVADYSTLGAEFIQRARKECPSLRLVMGWCGAPYHDATVFREWDLVLSCVPELVMEFAAMGHRSFHINHAFDERILKAIDPDAAEPVDFSFIGSIVMREGFHTERERILSHLVEHTDIALWCNVERSGSWRSFSKLSIVPSARIARRARPALYGLKMFQQLCRSRVTLNTHIDISAENASNMRLFEGTGIRSCLLTDWKSNLASLFDPEREVVTYRSPEECVEKVTYLLNHPVERMAIAEAGQRRTLGSHTFAARAQQIDEIVRSEIGRM